MASGYSSALQRLLTALPPRERLDPLRIIPASLWPEEKSEPSEEELADLTLAPIGKTGSPARLVERSFGFLDLVDFTPMVARMSAEETHGLMSVFRQLVREVAAARGCQVSRWVGDGVLIIGMDPGPVAATMVELASRLRSADVSACAGVACGEVLLFEGEDFIGSPVNCASRLSDVAKPGQVLAADELIEHLPSWIEAGPITSFKLKGLGKVKAVSISAPDC